MSHADKVTCVILSVFNYVLAFKLMIWYNAFVYTHFYVILVFKKYLHAIKSIINLCNYSYTYTVDPTP